MDHELVELCAAVREVLGDSGRTHVKPAGQPWKAVRAVPVAVFDRLEAALAEFEQHQSESLEASICRANEAAGSAT